MPAEVLRLPLRDTTDDCFGHHGVLEGQQNDCGVTIRLVRRHFEDVIDLEGLEPRTRSIGDGLLDVELHVVAIDLLSRRLIDATGMPDGHVDVPFRAAMPVKARKLILIDPNKGLGPATKGEIDGIVEHDDSSFFAIGQSTPSRVDRTKDT